MELSSSDVQPGKSEWSAPLHRSVHAIAFVRGRRPDVWDTASLEAGVCFSKLSASRLALNDCKRFFLHSHA